MTADDHAASSLSDEPVAGERARVGSPSRSFLVDLVVLVALPILLLLVNDSWSSGWLATPPGAEWVEASHKREAPPPGWLVNQTSTSLDTPVSWVDPYIYQSFFLDLKGSMAWHEEAYGLWSYYPSRLPWLLLGNAVFSVAPPETANLLLRLLLFYVATFSLYAVVRMTTGNALPALASALLLGVNSYFLWSIGWNYVDGFGITLILAMLACLTKAATSTWRMALVPAGIAAATALSINIFLVVVMPGALVWYLLLNARRQHHSHVLGVALMVAGGIIGFATFGLVNLYLTGSAHYLEAQIFWARHDFTPSTRSLYPEAGWLVLPAAAALLSLGFVILAAARRVRRRSLGASEYLGVSAAAVFLLTLGIYVYQEFLTPATTLQHAFYVSYLMPFAYLVIGACIHRLSSKYQLSERLRPLLAGAVIVCLLAPFALSQLRFMPGCPEGCLASGPLQLLLVAGVALMAAALLTRNARAGLALLMVFSLINVGVADRRVLTFSGSETEARHNRAAMVLDADGVVRRHNAANDMRYWVDLADPYGWVYAAVAGQGSRRVVSLEFPDMPRKRRLTAGVNVMLASAGGETIVQRANEALAPHALHLEVFERTRIQRGSDGFDLFLATVIPGAALPAQDGSLVQANEN